MKKKFYFTFAWLLTLLIAIIWAYENSDKISKLKDKLKIYKPKHEFVKENGDIDKDISVVEGNHFSLDVEKIISLDSKTSFLLNDSINREFNINDVDIFTQEGFKINKDKTIKLELNKNFTDDFSGGLKTVFFINENVYGLTSSLAGECYYASLVNLKTSDELLKSNCLYGLEIDFNGLGSSTIHIDNEILISIGTPTSSSNLINSYAQNKDFLFGKILSIQKNNLLSEKLSPKIYSMGHRNPQGITKIKKMIFSVEHGPKGGDELNKIIKNKNYGWPKVSYGAKYIFEKYNLDHEKNGYEEPIFAFVPSIGISSLNLCPSKLYNYYKKNCLIGLSLYGNDLRPGKSLLIFLLDKNLEKIHSIEKINLGKPLRHFMTNNKNEIFEDKDGHIYVSSDFDGIYRLNFNNFAKQ